MTTKRVLQKALKLFGPNGENWVRGVPNAEEHCAASALGAVASESDYEDARQVLLKQLKGVRMITNWNDASTWPEVEQAFLKAIEAAQ